MLAAILARADELIRRSFRFGTTAAQRPQVRVWHGERQRVGHLGYAQDDFNLVGEVDAGGATVSLTCTVNGNPPRSLTVGARKDGFGDGRRLARTGHFNADIPTAQLREGENIVVLEARVRRGEPATVTVIVERRSGSSALPLMLDWTSITSVQDAGQCVDGKLTPVHTGYDRTFLIGNRTWVDYEATVPVTVHRVDPKTGPNSGGNGLGLLFRFTGHVTGGPRNFPPGQPKWGYQPFGAIAWLRWADGADRPPAIQFYPGDRDGPTNHGTFAVREGATYLMRARCESLPDDASGAGATRYAFRIWEAGTTEPDDWAWQETQVSRTANRNGGLALLAHHVSVSFGTVDVRQLSPGLGT